MLENLHLILASGSPRRKALIESLGVPFSVVSQAVDESFPPDIPVSDVVAYLAEKKAKPFLSSLKENEVLITSDTVVVFENEILGKPENLNEAKTIIRKLSGNIHKVITGVALHSLNHKVVFSEETQVKFKVLKEEDIHYYVETFKPLDKAGAYGIQEWIGKIGVEKIEGCYYNVMGLPISRIWSELQHITF